MHYFTVGYDNTFLKNDAVTIKRLSGVFGRCLWLFTKCIHNNRYHFASLFNTNLGTKECNLLSGIQAAL